MVKQCSLLLSARLRKLTDLRPKVRNITWWSSTYEMLRWYVQIRQVVAKLESDEIDAMTLSSSENCRVESLILQIEPLSSLTKALQHDSLTVCEDKVFFDAVIEKYPESTDCLSASAGIIHCPNFESALVKIQRGEVSALSLEEKFEVSKFTSVVNQTTESQDIGMSFTQRALKKSEAQ